MTKKNKFISLVVTAFIILLSQTIYAGGGKFIKTLDPDRDGVIELSQDAQDIARFGCLTHPSCTQNFVASSGPCEAAWGGSECYRCDVRPDLYRAASCPTGWSIQSQWTQAGYRCESECFTNCRNHSSNSEEMQSCLASCHTPATPEHICPNGFALSRNSDETFYCNFENIEDPSTMYNVCTQCFHTGVPSYEAPTITRGSFYCVNYSRLAGSGGSTPPPESGSGGSGVPVKGGYGGSVGAAGTAGKPVKGSGGSSGKVLGSGGSGGK